MHRYAEEGADYAMTFRTNGGVIDPTTHKEVSHMQFIVGGFTRCNPVGPIA